MFGLRWHLSHRVDQPTIQKAPPPGAPVLARKIVEPRIIERPATVDPQDPEYRMRAILFNDITHAPLTYEGYFRFSTRQEIADYLYQQGWRRPERPEDITS